MPQIKRKWFLIPIGGVLLGILALFLGLKFIESQRRIRGTVYSEPNSCINAGFGCAEYYIQTDGGKNCSISKDIAERYKGQRVEIDGQQQETMSAISVCFVSNIQSVRSL